MIVYKKHRTVNRPFGKITNLVELPFSYACKRLNTTEHSLKFSKNTQSQLYN